MNDNFNKALEATGKSAYRLSKDTGVPYTTISELVNGKIDINKCACDTVLKLATALHTSIEYILNPTHFLDGMSGKHNGIKYKWRYVENVGMAIDFIYEGNPVTIQTENDYNLIKRLYHYSVCAGFRIDEYIEQKEFDKHAEKILKERKERAHV